MPLQSRDYTLAELIAEFDATVSREGRSNCPVSAHLKAHPDWTIQQYEDWIFSHPQYCAPVCCDVIRTAGLHNPPHVTAEIQELYASKLVQCDWAKARVHVEQMLHAEQITHGVCAPAMVLIAAWIAANHPNPVGFFAQTHPARHVAHLTGA